MAIASSMKRRTKKGQMKRKGEAGAAKNYITRSQALKKLQCTLSDFRRLCILKGIYPREPRNRKKANRGSSVPSSFYYVKDIQYLLHEPILHKLREQKAFAKKLSRAIGRQEWTQAQRLHSTRPAYTLDHVIKERYPTFQDALRDIDDALSLVVLFAYLPAAKAVNATITENCTRLVQQWQLYVMKTHSLRKVFLSIKGVYYQANIHGETVTWLSPYVFTQKIPHDLDYRIMLTFIELYQTVLGFVLYKLYADANMVYPPRLDEALDDEGAGLSALVIESQQSENGNAPHVALLGQGAATDPKSVSKRQLRQAIKKVESEGVPHNNDDDDAIPAEKPLADSEPSATDFDREGPSFDPYFMKDTVIFLSREVSRTLLEFVAVSAGAQVGWDPILGAGSPFSENDPRITHHIVDRPVSEDGFVPPASHEGRRVYVQPQWLVDSVNRNTLLPAGDYAPGAILPPHLSPFVSDEELRQRGEYVPGDPAGEPMSEDEAANDDEAASDDGAINDDDATNKDNGNTAHSSQESSNDNDDSDAANESTATSDAQPDHIKPDAWTHIINKLAQNPDDETLYASAETEAELRGKSMADFEADLAKAKAALSAARKAEAAKGPRPGSKNAASEEERLASIMLTGSQKKLYKKMAHSKALRQEQKAKLEKRRRKLTQ